MSNPIILTRDKVKREWSDFEPKLVAALLGGGGFAIASAIITPIAKKMGVEVPIEFIEFVPLAVAGFIGWLTPSVGTTVTSNTPAGRRSETHSGNPVTTVTASTPVQAPAPTPIQVQQTSPGVFTKVLSGQDETPAPDPNAPTQVLGSDSSRASSFLNTLPSSTGEHQW